jgi:transcriptional regulator with XRE-family HTH domain
MATQYRITSPLQLTEYVRAIRKARGETQADVAKKLGVSKMRVAAMERDLGRLSVHRLITLLHLLDAHLELEVPGTPRIPMNADAAASQKDKPEAAPRTGHKRVGEW